MERRTRMWIGLSTALLVSTASAERVVIARESPVADAVKKAGATAPVPRPRVHVAQVEASGEGGPNEGGGPVLGTITEFRLSTNDPSAFVYDAKQQVTGYVDLVSASYAAAHAAADALRGAVAALAEAPGAETLEATRVAWSAARAAYLDTEAFLFYAGPVDGPGGPFPRLNIWPVDPAGIDGLIADGAQSLNFRALARLNKIEPPVKITTGLHVLEYLLWGADGGLTAEAFASEPRRGEYSAAAAQLLVNDLSVVNAAWAAGANNYRASVEAMDQRNALGRAFNGMAALLGYEIPLRRIGAGLFPANENFQPSPYSGTSAEDNRFAFEGARKVYFDAGLDKLVEATDAELAGKIVVGFEAADAALGAMNAPYERFLAPPAGSADRATAEAAVKALTNLARDLRQAGNRLGILVVVPGM
ncbi:MAG TPA: imelysin family protein [Devosia sp.]|nr:imelysin family protein [Devosia sp.]